MVPEQLEPRLDLLREEYVLVQAWKKTASYIRYHNWYSDTLALDLAAANLPTFLGKIRDRLESSDTWQNEPLRIVLAPKSQRWRLREDSWEPVEKGAKAARLRPLAHVSIADQVVATALMLCLANRIETLQGDPRQSIRREQHRKRVISYGNRLYCDAFDEELRHRWGSTKLYRAYYQDYRAFLSRPEVVAESLSEGNGSRLYVVHADLKQFYDRVSPDLLARSINSIRRDDDDPAFFDLATRLNWKWDVRDQRHEIPIYTEQAGINDFTRVALPQGLVASGFFANIVLLAFDRALCDTIGTDIAPGIQLTDVCRYVDDLRVLITVESSSNDSLRGYESVVSEWLTQVLDVTAPGLTLSPDKTEIAALGHDDRPLVRQSAKMNRIQSAVSGGFDALAGEEILDSIQGLMRTQEALSTGDDTDWRLSPIPDVRDQTVARFGAARYRVTFRSIRPLLQDDEIIDETEFGLSDSVPDDRLRVVRTRRDLDDDARAFALGLIQRWIEDPSNVRLLRIGLDLWPDREVLREVLSLLRPFTETGGRRKAPRRVAWYCLAEVLRAGATETGLVEDTESLPTGIDLSSYRDELRDEAARLLKLPGPTIPWYLRQQALLFLAASDPAGAPVVRTGTGPETRHYRELIRFLRGEGDKLRSSDFATIAVVARRSFVNRKVAVELTWPGLSSSRTRQLALRDPSFLLELIESDKDGSILGELPARARDDLCKASEESESNHNTLARVVLRTHPTGALRNELSLLRFARSFLKHWRHLDPPPKVITPVQVQLKVVEEHGIANVRDLRILKSRVDPSGSLYEVPRWCEAGERWRFQLGFLLRFILSGQRDFTRPVRRASWKESESAYRPAESHWHQRLYGLYSGQPAFGDDWLPITDWGEEFLLALLRWPGCRTPDRFIWIEQDVEVVCGKISERITDLASRQGSAATGLTLPLVAKRTTPTNEKRPLRACVVQTAIPGSDEIKKADLGLNKPAIRRKHRNHLSAALAAVERMLALRETHKGNQGRLDWLILPELAVHPDDVRTHLIPFARTHRAIVLAGMTYEQLLPGQPLINSSMWVIPEWSDAYGLQIKTRRQGKAHLAPNEQLFNGGTTHLLRGFRPCQWLIGYPWCNEDSSRPAWLTSAVCYDATDLGLAADLRDESDILAIPALNMDVDTFDHMALALHYHMFQLVIVANNGQYGGSNAYWPMKKHYIRQVFHSHGQPQASISFLEIDDMAEFLSRHDPSATSAKRWKYPPAGLKSKP